MFDHLARDIDRISVTSEPEAESETNVSRRFVAGILNHGFPSSPISFHSGNVETNRYVALFFGGRFLLSYTNISSG